MGFLCGRLGIGMWSKAASFKLKNETETVLLKRGAGLTI
jgi:hypothetical protein